MSKYDFTDVFWTKKTEPQIEKISDSFHAKDEKALKELVWKASYCTKCYEEFNSVFGYTRPKIDVIEAYWRKIGCMFNEDENPKYLYLSSLAPNCLVDVSWK